MANYGTKEYYKENIAKIKLEFDLLNESIGNRIIDYFTKKSMDHEKLIQADCFFAEFEQYKEILESAKNSLKYAEEELAKLEAADNGTDTK